MLKAFNIVEDKNHPIPGRKGGNGALQGHAVHGTGKDRIAGAEVAFRGRLLP